MITFHSDVADRLRKHNKVCAAWVQMGSSISAEIFAEAGFDMIVIDAEHSPTTLPNLVSIMQAIKGTNCFPMVRAPWNDQITIKQILDCGAGGIHIPYVSTVEEAENAVKYCKYPPRGVRGIAGSQRAVCYGQKKSEYYAFADNEIIVVVAIETLAGVININDIINVDGIDGIFIGPADLSTSMGHMANPSHPDVQKAIATVESAVIPSGKFLGTVASDMNDAIAKYNKGYTLLYVMSDTTSLSSIAMKTVDQFKTYRQSINQNLL